MSKLRSVKFDAGHRWMVLALMVVFTAFAGQVHGATRGVVLSWDAPATTNSIAEYHVFYGTQSGIYTNSVTASSLDSAGFIIRNLQGDKTYYFAVMAVDTDGHSSSISTEASLFLAIPKPVKLQMEVYADDNNVPFAMVISGTNTTTTDWELDCSSDLKNWTYLTGDHGIDIYYVAYFADADRMFYRLVDH